MEGITSYIRFVTLREGSKDLILQKINEALGFKYGPITRNYRSCAYELYVVNHRRGCLFIESHRIQIRLEQGLQSLLRSFCSRSEMSFSAGTRLIPHPAKVEKGGEDAYFVSSYKGGVLGIADGVSGWAEKNVNPALFPQELMKNASSFIMDEEVNYDPQILLRKAHAATSSKGSATVLIAMLENNGTLKIASIGDCGLRVFRNGLLIFSTQPQEHYFDCPYQLSSEMISQTYLDAMVCSLDLQEGDTIVMGSDGLFDNVFDQEIISTIYKFEDVNSAANELASLASGHSNDTNFDSPYSIEARNRGFDVPLWKKILGRKLTGGKPDDITVIVGRVESLV